MANFQHLLHGQFRQFLSQSETHASPRRQSLEFNIKVGEIIDSGEIASPDIDVYSAESWSQNGLLKSVFRECRKESRQRDTLVSVTTLRCF